MTHSASRALLLAEGAQVHTFNTQIQPLTCSKIQNVLKSRGKNLTNIIKLNSVKHNLANM